MSTENPVPKIRFQSLAELTRSQIDAIRSIPAHDQVHYPALRATRPTSMFLDPAHFELEQQKVFRRLPVAVALSVTVQEPNSYVAQDGYGPPLLVTRDRAGKAHVFLNVCLHKGSKLVAAGEPRQGGRLSCPYHGWTWGVDGKLVGVARAETFADLDRAQRDLVELPSREAGGIIFAILDPKAAPDFGLLHDDLVADLQALDLAGQYLYGRRTFHLDANWKQVIEPFLEGYHVQRLHAQSVGPLFADVPTVVTRLGDHLRQTSGKADFTPADLEGAKNIHKTVTHAYLVFPNTVLVTSPYYMSVMFIMPDAVGRTTVDYHMLTLNPVDNPQAEQLYKTSYETVLGVFGNEDFAAAETCYAGLRSGALDPIDVVYCGLEQCIPMQYETLDKYLNA
jgi:phenylpropionate dioxygenase-like ring-hydroxylating dioxygenase large terminal subunit